MIYVDDMNIPFGKMIMCHMVADTREELLNMAKKIGVPRRWIQDKGTNREHFDICLTKKRKALSAGAKEVGMRELTKMTIERDLEKYLSSAENAQMKLF